MGKVGKFVGIPQILSPELAVGAVVTPEDAAMLKEVVSPPPLVPGAPTGITPLTPFVNSTQIVLPLSTTPASCTRE